MPIQVLSQDVAAKIAAGEMIERPASVVKELLENAIDAGATDIRIEIREGGIRLIRIVDDGCGIPADETETAFLRHATSKLHTIEDLDRILTLGFRGEALASVGAVSQVTLLTRTALEDVGSRLRLEAGILVQHGGQGGPVGTSVTVENLFYNVPARRKFLRSEATEAAHILTLVTRYALAWPDLRFSLTRDGRLTFQSTGSSRMSDVILKLYELDTVRQLVEFGREIPGEDTAEMTAPVSPGKVAAWGYTSLPSLTRADRSHITVFVNRRLVQDRLLSRAILDAYHGLLTSGRYPLTILQLRVDPADVDVNVHPTKAEIRFRHPQDAFTAVQKAMRQALRETSPVRSLDAMPQSPSAPVPVQSQLSWPGRPHFSPGRLALELQRTSDAPAHSAVDEGGPGPSSSDNFGRDAVDHDAPPRNLPPLRVIGQLDQTYIIAEGPGGLYLIDQHTAHERVLYERFRSEQLRQGVTQQQLLTPFTVELAPVHAAALTDRVDTVSMLGFELEPFGDETLLVRTIPAMLNPNEVTDTLTDLASRLTSAMGGDDLFEESLITVVCHSAVRAGKSLTYEEMRDLIRQLEQTSLPHTCPHGRPIFLHLSTDRLAHAFGRT